MKNRTAPFPLIPACVAACAMVLACGPPGGGTGDGEGPATPDYPELRSSVCDTLTNSFQCARAIEARQLPGVNSVERRGDTLALALEDGDTLRLVDREGDPSDVIHYSYQDHWPDVGLVLVQVQYYEGSEYLLVDASSGASTTLPHWPLRSPDGRRFAVLSLDLAAGYGPNTLQIWDLVDGDPVRLWETEPEDWGPAEGEWEDPTTLRFTRRGFCEDPAGPGREVCDTPALLRQSGGSWRLETGELDGN